MLFLFLLSFLHFHQLVMFERDNLLNYLSKYLCKQNLCLYYRADLYKSFLFAHNTYLKAILILLNYLIL